MKILFLSNLFPPNQLGGYEVLCCQVANLIAQRGHEVHVLTSCYGGRISSAGNMTISQGLRLLCGDTIYQPFAKGDVRRQVISEDNMIVTRRMAERIRPDVIFAWNLHGLEKDYFHAIEALGVPVVAMITDNWLAAMMMPEFIGRYFERHVYGEKPGGKLASAGSMQTLGGAAIFGSRYMQDLYAAAGLDFVTTKVIYNGVDLEAQLARKRKSRQIPVNGASGPVRLLFAGRLVRLKGPHLVIEALGHLMRHTASPGRNFFLTVVGDGTDAEYLQQLKSLVQQYDLADKVSFVLPVSEAELPGLFDEHDIFVFPSLYEPFSLTLIHAMASGIPIVASNVGGNIEIVRDGQTGLTFNAGDTRELAGAIERLAASGELREQISSAGCVTATQFSITRMVDQMEAFLRQVQGGAQCQ